MNTTALVGAGFALAGAVVALAFLPARSHNDDRDERTRREGVVEASA